MNINSMAFVAPNLVCGEAQGGSIPQRWGCDRRATKPQAKFGATRRAAGLFRPDFVARSLQIHGGICASLAPRLSEKSLAANVIAFMFMTTNASTYQISHCETFDNSLWLNDPVGPGTAKRPAGTPEISLWSDCAATSAFCILHSSFCLSPLPPPGTAATAAPAATAA